MEDTREIKRLFCQNLTKNPTGARTSVSLSSKETGFQVWLMTRGQIIRRSDVIVTPLLMPFFLEVSHHFLKHPRPTYLILLKYLGDPTSPEHFLDPIPTQKELVPSFVAAPPCFTWTVQYDQKYGNSFSPRVCTIFYNSYKNVILMTLDSLHHGLERTLKSAHTSQAENDPLQSRGKEQTILWSTHEKRYCRCSNDKLRGEAVPQVQP
ncbi:hypothetical protein V6N12_011618 [Hibiscus sabdariffa]|uniref:Uncharacterized protein n=1 Tax=Hibiscus sabdariffa TaxID=183260 RepID=A0ABR2AZP2_9ROSI